MEIKSLIESAENYIQTLNSEIENMLKYQDSFKERKDEIAIKTRKTIKNFVKNHKKDINHRRRIVNSLVKLDKIMNG